MDTLCCIKRLKLIPLFVVPTLLIFTVFSGTEKQHVADDYAKRLHIGQVECEVRSDQV